MSGTGSIKLGEGDAQLCRPGFWLVPDAGIPRRCELVTNAGTNYTLPLFLPVYQPRRRVFQLAIGQKEPEIRGIIVNAYFLYKQREIRKLLTTELTLSDYVGFKGLIVTDSGAFQSFTRRVYLRNRDIIHFQDCIRSDIISPLDVVTPPGDNRRTAEAKLLVTQARVREALAIVEHGIVAGVQQGGRYLDLRHRAARELLDMGVRYLAIGSLVPMFNKDHNLEFVGKVLMDARSAAGPSMPIHVYGAGDPCELPFMFALGANVFDSASYAQFGHGGWYMTPYGALQDPGPLLAGEYRCSCSVCTSVSEHIRDVFNDPVALARHNLATIGATMTKLQQMTGDDSALNKYLLEVLEAHMRWFPGSALRRSWELLHG